MSANMKENRLRQVDIRKMLHISYESYNIEI